MTQQYGVKLYQRHKAVESYNLGGWVAEWSGESVSPGYYTPSHILRSQDRTAGSIPVAAQTRDPPYHRGFGDCGP